MLEIDGSDRKISNNGVYTMETTDRIARNQ